MDLLLIQIIAGTLFVGLFLFFFCVYILIFGQTKMHKDGWIGNLNERIMNSLNNCGSGAIQTADKFYFFKCLTGIRDYCFYSKNPFMQLFYLGIMGGNIICFFFVNLPRAPAEIRDKWHWINYPVGLFLLAFALFSFFVASYSNPGIVTKKRLYAFIKSFPYDTVLYQKTDFCKWCKIPKPARAKHCRLTQRCVSKFDHFCPWINNAVGEYNYRYFHMFIVSNILLSLFMFQICVTFMYYIIVHNDLTNVTFVTTKGKKIESSVAVILQYLLNNYIWAIAQTFMIIAMGLMLAFFEVFHFFKIIWPNVTTYEGFKRDEVDRQIRIIKRYGIDSNYPLSSYLRDKQILGIERLLKKGKRYRNIYDKGLIYNFKEMLYPPTLFRNRGVKGLEIDSDDEDEEEEEDSTEDQGEKKKKKKKQPQKKKKNVKVGGGTKKKGGKKQPKKKQPKKVGKKKKRN